jgi:hypothetical protein
MLYENSWTIKGKTYLRYFDKKSKKIQVNVKPEYYVKDKNGSYVSFLDKLPLSKKTGSAWDNPDAYGAISGDYVCIRDLFFQKDNYNLSPCIWFFDIETAVGENSEGFPTPENADERVVLIQIFNTSNDTIYIIVLEDWYHQSDYKYDYEV